MPSPVVGIEIHGQCKWAPLYAPRVVRNFAIVGQKASSTDEFILDDLPGTSGRLDVLVRCLRAAMLSSHGIRRGVVVYLVLLGGKRAPRVVRVDGAAVLFLRPDERSLAVRMKKVLATHADEETSAWVTARPGFAVARGGFERVLADVDDAVPYILDEGGLDIREAPGLGASHGLFVIGDHLGLPDDVRLRLEGMNAQRISVGPVSVHADDVVTLVTNELDRCVVKLRSGREPQ
ncbi:MAG TPA: tRNA (pseudouridine(54)-N(1))-methyltransferase TrmY [Labilithrix sp.]|nr:tRNA (pseudouridine(54)-N(1))-methyltransferase TrmY [Labilithrix sp.]